MVQLLQYFLWQFVMTIKIEEKIRKESKKRMKSNKYKANQQKIFKHPHQKTVSPIEIRRRNNKHYSFENFKIKIQEHKQKANEFQRFKIRIPNIPLCKKEGRFFRIKIKEIVERCRDDSKLHLSDCTNDSQLLQNNSLQQNANLKQVKPQWTHINKFRQFIHFRNTLLAQKNLISKKNTSCCTLIQLVTICFQKNLVIKSVFNKFIINYNDKVELGIIENIKDQVKQIKMKNHLFFLIDHRILTKLLSYHFPDEYEIVNEATVFSAQANQYLKEIYEIEEIEYFQKYNEFNKRYQRFWMPESSEILESNRLKLNYEDDIEDISKMKSCGRILRFRN